MKLHWLLCGSLAVVRAIPDLLEGPGLPLELRDAKLPSCSTQCLKTLAPKYVCELTDIDCLCTNTKLIEPFGVCVAANCSVIDALATQKYQTISCALPIRNQGSITRRTWIALFAVSLTAIALRFLVRAPWLNGAGYGWDDWTILVVLAFLVPHEAGLEIMIQNGLGRDLWMLTPSQITTCLHFFWLGEMCYTCVVMLTKIAILFLYLRIFPSTVSTWFRTSCFVLIGACTFGAIGMVIALVFECDPMSGAYERWDGTHPTKCIDTKAQVIAMAGINIVLDLIVFFLPIPKVLKLHASNRKKVGICFAFLVGLFVTIVSIVRLIALIPNIDTTNPTWDFNPITIWSHAEVNVGVVCACLPCVAGQIKRCWNATIGWYVVSKIGELSRSRNSKRQSVQGDEGELRNLPSHTVAKTMDTTVVFNKRVNSSDEFQLVDKSSQGSLESTVSPHKYIREWNT